MRSQAGAGRALRPSVQDGGLGLRLIFFFLSPPGVLSVALLFMLAWAGALVLIFTVGGAGLARSQYTQAHGVLRSGTVINSQNVVVGTKPNPGKNAGSSPVYEGRVLVQLAGPVGGQARTTVNVPHQVSYAQGKAISVLVDPKEPGYAELPGIPEKTPAKEIVLTIVFSVLLAVSAVGVFFAARWWWRSRRRSLLTA